MSEKASQTTPSTSGTGRPRKSDRAGFPSFQFIVSTPSHRLGPQDRKAIKGNATRQRKYQRQMPQLQSWIIPGHELASLEYSRAIHETAIPKRAGTDFSGLQLPPGFEPHMLQELIKGFQISKMAVYPYEICIEVPPAERGWFPYMLSDACCLHSMLFSLHVYEGRTTHSQLDRLACYHYDQTLRLLQSRLHECDLTNAVSDATIMVVIMLASVAEVMNEHDTVEGHIRGLEKIVTLRGGVRSLTTHTNMPVKVCRADLSFALSTGRRPLLFDSGLTWDCFIAGRNFAKCSHNTCYSSILSCLEDFIGVRLRNVTKDVHALSCLSNLAYQTKSKLSPELYNEMTISVLYRLAHLSCEDCDLQEGIRLGLLCFCSTVFMQRQYMEKPHGYLLNHFMSTLRRLCGKSSKVQADPILFWLLMVSAVIARAADNCLPHWHGLWLKESIELNEVGSWSQARDMLRSIAWIDFAHDKAGKTAFDEANHASTPLSAATGLNP